jgi:hypothetical protein
MIGAIHVDRPGGYEQGAGAAASVHLYGPKGGDIGRALISREDAREAGKRLTRFAGDSRVQCVVSFCGEAHDAAARVLSSAIGWSFEIHQSDGTAPYTGTLELVEIDADTEQYVAVFRVWPGDDDPGTGPDVERRRLDIYDDVDKMMVW